jgi:hypothetical protein
VVYVIDLFSWGRIKIFILDKKNLNLEFSVADLLKNVCLSDGYRFISYSELQNFH